ncbi:olfactory receptor 14A16-like [Solea senegalensis]|uniref:Olfactory receptor 14A16-like n=1 Tax=Solea senegalensis TaxID=28829 RepID=A0AAV6SVL3_SOLSE|nr:putative olfactory receptor 14L1 [Solea senegalensis]KAG7520864.1 olfactory receptor 14A16-like [Solea senegalensis]
MGTGHEVGVKVKANIITSLEDDWIRADCFAAMRTTETHNNVTDRCDWSMSAENGTETRVNGRLDPAACLFRSIMPNSGHVPVLVCVLVLLTLVSLLVNGFTLFRLGRSDDLSWEPRFAFLKNLILSDLMQTVTIGPAVIHSLVHRRTMEFNVWCHVQFFAGTTSIFASLMTITCMALERYLYVCHAIHYLVILTKVRLRVTLSLIWCFSLSISCVTMTLLHLSPPRQIDRAAKGLICEPDVVEQHMGFPRASAIFRKFTGSCTLLLCLVVYAFSYLRMYRDARNAVMPFKAVNKTARKTVLFYCSMLFLQLLPLLIKVVSDALWEVEGTVAMMTPSSPTQGPGGVRNDATPTPSATAVGLHMTLLVLLIVPPCINPLVYMMRSAEMRRVMRRMFRQWREESWQQGGRDAVEPTLTGVDYTL